MNAAKLIGLGINVSLVLMVFGLALSSGTARVGALFRQPGLAARSFLAMFVVMPVVAVLIAKNLDLNRELLVALLLVALSPIPPILPGKQLKTGGDPDFVFGLLALSALGAILVVPGGVALIGRVFGQDLDVPYAVTARVVVISLLLPAILGLVLARFAPVLAQKLARPASIIGLVLLVAASLPLLWKIWGTMMGEMHNFTLVAMIAFVAIGLLTGSARRASSVGRAGTGRRARSRAGGRPPVATGSRGCRSATPWRRRSPRSRPAAGSRG